jgi:hypothetical protein
MGRYLKNREIPTASYSVRIPIGTNALGPDSPVTGLIRFNETEDNPQVYLKNAWRNFLITLDPIIYPSKDTFYGDGNTVDFGPMQYGYLQGNEIMILVFIGNVFQNPGIAYIVSDTTISFTSPPPAGHQIIILHGFAR